MSALPEGLLAARAQVVEELKRADAKATTLLSLVGLALAGVVALSGRPLPLVALVALWVSAVPVLAGVLVLLSAIRPRLGDVACGSWLHAAQVGPESLLRVYADTDESAVAASTHLCALAVITRSKYRRIQVAVTLLVVGLGVLAVALVLSVVTR
ncbi:MAG: DUF5706 domain-containing protein [Actinomycetota bacterium]|nr:DUF5706 domain-containing protein [Actinomycetota bacterium]